MTAAGTCVIAFGQTRLVMAWEGSASLEIIDALHPCEPAPDDSDSAPPRYRLQQDPHDDFRLTQKGRVLYAGPSPGKVAGILLDSTAYDMADGCRTGPLFHAAAALYHGQGILMPGNTGAGKTTLSAWLASRGWNYLTDEIACVDKGSQRIVAFCRALNIKEPAADFIAPLLSTAAGKGAAPGEKAIYRSPRSFIVPVERIRPANEYGTPPLRLILFPRYVRGADDDIARLTRAQTGARLMGCALNIRNLPGHGFHDISQLARRIPAYSLTYGRLDNLVEKIAALLDEAQPRDLRHR